MKKCNKVGEINYNTYGNKMTIIEYNLYSDIIVKFENGYIKKTNYNNFKNGMVDNPYDKSVYNIGYFGEGKYNNINNREIYQYWFDMMKRCYSKTFQDKNHTYEICTVCNEWLNFQTFAEWCDNNYYEIDNERMQIDKDIIHKGNKIYSPKHCVFVPIRINSLFTKSDIKRGDYPIGVSFYKKSNNYMSYCSYLKNGKKKKKHLGYFNTPEETFYKGYKPFKESYIKQVADEYKETIPKQLYDAMYKYKVEITD